MARDIVTITAKSASSERAFGMENDGYANKANNAGIFQSLQFSHGKSFQFDVLSVRLLVG
jgi:hypothetical protein